MSSTQQQLQQAYELIKAGRKAEAVKILTPIVTFDEDNANAWWLMANASDLPEDIREALEHVLRLKPDNDKAQYMLEQLNIKYPPRQKAKNDEFSFDDDPFADIDDYQPKVYRKGSGAVSAGTPQRIQVTKSKSGTNPLVIVLAFIGVLTLVGCLVCVGTGALGTLAFGQVVQQVMNDPTVQAAMSDPTVQAAFEQIGEEVNRQSLNTSDVTMRGTILRGTTERATVDAFTDDGWTFNGELGESIMIEAVSPDGELDTVLYLYNSDGQLLAENDDIEFGDNTNSRIEISMPYNGQYTIVVSAFGSGGDYELTVR
jgi:hypothetical protein